ncbi:LacI family transcriptional regulator [Lederbergia sp. NSJ-179]|uniref:LacI family DNA-binding transcriptional regulator n=1 Tax=Lederbergia sp. NSJ-179 TaxID=2931402 RepID=UPI001FD24544|nr:LacI family DNA-binding transcriptional regulator [Lederbergia sp. NSJ-179]MCJ7840280.1 LacI family transcriptional regulator [Lederbergia sp. NSJ-179]
MSVTIKDVAKHANVAPSTVSRVIADNPRISDETKKRVRKAMKELGYHPNLIARSLANQSTSVIGLVMPESADVIFQNPFFSSVLQGLSASAYEKTYALQMTTGKTKDEIFQEVVQMVQGRRVDGLVLLNSHVEDRLMSYLMNCGFPFVVVGKPYKNEDQITHIDNDNFRASKEATEYLLGLHHERIAFIGGNRDLVVTVDRLLGYEKALREAGIELRDSYIVHAEFLKEGGQEAIDELLKLDDPPTALVVTDDLMTLGVLHMLDKMGISVAKQMSIVSFNNVFLAQMTQPPLTSVDINIFSLGYEAAKNLILKIENPKEPVKRIIIPHQLVIRSSCAAL